MENVKVWYTLPEGYPEKGSLVECNVRLDMGGHYYTTGVVVYLNIYSEYYLKSLSGRKIPFSAIIEWRYVPTIKREA